MALIAISRISQLDVKFETSAKNTGQLIKYIFITELIPSLCRKSIVFTRFYMNILIQSIHSMTGILA